MVEQNGHVDLSWNDPANNFGVQLMLGIAAFKGVFVISVKVDSST